MLIGEYEHTIDIKGRVIVPSKFREDLSDLFYLSKGLDKCLFVFSKKEWVKLQHKITSIPISKSHGLQRFFFSGAVEAIVDKQGRMLIPQVLRNFASLEKEISFIGASSRAEIWDRSRWKEISNSLTDETIKQAMDLLDL
ncbi:MAG: division/cell wall cluster transcriptional repressor MraZ [Oscillospiraceae bacterium]|jgi:MraZ protein|nr:division/cell wall cluster transcriptional repressor MraZ [Oscillospiraceae bacterium]